jgi:hypothetical protein
METPLITLSEMQKKTEEVKSQGGLQPSVQPPPKPPVVEPLAPPVSLPSLNEMRQKTKAANPNIEFSAPPLTVEGVVSDPERLSKIRNMMTKDEGVYWQEAPPEELMETFMTKMRYMNTNEVSTGAMLMKLASADEDTLATYGDAFKVYEEMGSMFSNGDAWNGMLDYTGSVLTSPSTYFGFGIGKAATTVASRGGAAALMKTAIKSATNQIVKASGGKVAAETVEQTLKASTAKSAARYAIAGTLAVEAPMSTLQDYMLQDIYMKTDVQDEYSLMQGAIATLAGSLSAIPSAGVLIRNEGGTLQRTGELVEASYKLRAQNAAKNAVPEITKSLKKAKVDWEKLTKAGIPYDQNVALQKSIVDFFWDVENPDSVISILQKEGANLKYGKGEFTKSFVSFLKNIGDDNIEEFNKVLEPIGIKIGEAATFNFDTATNILARYAQQLGEDFAGISGVSRWYEKMRGVSAARKKAQENIMNGAEETKDVPLTTASLLSYIQSIWKRTITSSLSTTGANVQGFAFARSATALADIAAAGGWLGKAGIRAVINPAGAAKDAAMAKSLMANQTFALQSLLDPFTSREAFEGLLQGVPEKIKKRVTGQLYGGVETFSPGRFGLPETSKTIRAIEVTTKNLQEATLVNLQNSLTQGISGLTAADKRARIRTGEGIVSLINKGETWRLTDEDWEKITDTILKESFSEDLTKGKGFLGSIAAQGATLVEKVASNPVGGFLLPFGRFMNSTLAFLYRHSPLGFATPATRVFSQGLDEEIMEATARATVGTVFAAYMVADDKEKQDKNLQWFEKPQADGSIQNITNMQPEATYALTARIWNNWVSGEGMEKGLLTSLAQMISPTEAFEDIASPPFLKDLAQYITDDRIPVEEKLSMAGHISVALEYVSGEVGNIAGGFLRPFEIINRGLSYNEPEMGMGITVDRKLAEGGTEKFMLGLTRYVSGFMNYAFGEENEEGVRLYGQPKESATSVGPVRTPNPLLGYFGANIQGPRTKLNELLAMVDKPPYLADSFTSGVPEYDAFINKEVTPLLEYRARELMSKPVFKDAPKSAQIEQVNRMLSETQAEIVFMLEGKHIGTDEERLLNEKRKFFVSVGRAARRRAMKALGIDKKEADLTAYEMEAIRRYSELEEESFK